jgi:IstB-like ATP binding protein
LIDQLRCLERYGLLVVDEVGYLPLERQAANLLFALVSRRYERGPIVVTSNRGFDAWGEILGDAMVATALIDRLVHHASATRAPGPPAPSPRAGRSRRAPSPSWASTSPSSRATRRSPRWRTRSSGRSRRR